MPSKKLEITEKQKIELVKAIISQLIDIFSNNFQHIFGEDADIAFSMGGCEAIAVILKELFPEGNLLYSSHHVVFNMCGMDFDVHEKSQPEGEYTSAGEAGFYPISDWTKKEYTPIIEYSLIRIRESWPYFWDNTDTFDKLTQREKNGRYLTYKEYQQAKGNRQNPSNDNLVQGI